MTKVKLDPYLKPCTGIIPKWIKDLKVKNETTKVQEKPKIFSLVYIFKENFPIVGKFPFKLAHFPPHFADVIICRSQA